MQFNVAQLLKEPTGSTRRYELVEDIRDIDPELELLGPLMGQVQLMRTHSGVLARGHLSTAVKVMCNRCLEPIAMAVRFDFEESFRPLTEVHTGRFILPQEFEGASEELEDEALLIDAHHILDISEVVRQNIWLALPMYPGCNWEGAGECPNWLNYQQDMRNVDVSLITEEEQEADTGSIDPRWAALLQLRSRLEDE
ncbi:DUF177 domain-containing protein [Litorilinea aerophila]|uniref:DUF177 domain-containing protein n=1 Tax=Litorilinea aerophila TaxID=1204385 RepID=A0A540VJ68_9CHLR|nr:DUF177 domain-containing protein [Litorilinea aerophila]MCC9076210.1 DUF177 domain-containing protein [Litorilinea aerophila]OUC05586.1 hypothetical protein RY27_26380 [Litorilinea aerophila]GIV78910.1 MAG: hypothetical protein KatS3mg050_3304 [Litorilinea sp.]